MTPGHSSLAIAPMATLGYGSPFDNLGRCNEAVAAWFKIPFWQRVLAGFVLGALAGWAFGPSAETWFGPLGDLYVTLIKMIGCRWCSSR
jgi:hypothetical protein